MCNGGYLLRIKCRNVKLLPHSLPNSVVVTNECTCTSISPYVFMTFTMTFYLPNIILRYLHILCNQNVAEVYGKLKVNLRWNWTQIQAPATLFPIKRHLNFYLQRLNGPHQRSGLQFENVNRLRLKIKWPSDKTFALFVVKFAAGYSMLKQVREVECLRHIWDILE
jgi:hypothetical protein